MQNQDHDQQYVQLQLHDDINAFQQHQLQHQMDPTAGIYTPDYYGYYSADQQQTYGVQQLQPKSITAKRPLRPASAIPVSAPSAANSHVRTLPAKAGATSSSSNTSSFGNVANQSAFINKLYTMLEEADPNLITWDETGTFFIVKNTTGDFSKLVLPLYFKHNNFASFVRQLNMYGFHKINDSFFKLNNACSEIWEFKHHDFRRGEVALLSNIKRKAPKSSSSASKSSQAKSYQNNNNSITSSPLCMLTPNLPGPAGTPSTLKMDSCSDLSGYLMQTSHSFGGNDKVEELSSKVYELECKLATLSESYELVCNQTLSCKKELAGYSGIMTHVVSVLATMAQNEPTNKQVHAEIAKLAQATLEVAAASPYHSSSQVRNDSPIQRRESTDDLDAEYDMDDLASEGSTAADVNEVEEVKEAEQPKDAEEEQDIRKDGRSKKRGADKRGGDTQKKKIKAESSASLLTPPIGMPPGKSAKKSKNAK